MTSLSTPEGRRVHDVRGPILGELHGIIVEGPNGFRAYDQTESFIDTYPTMEAAVDAIAAAYIPPPPCPRPKGARS